MTISSAVSQNIFVGNGATNPFSYNFVCDSASTFEALYTDLTGVTTLLLPAQYTLFRNPVAIGSLHSIGGTITYPTAGPPIANGTSLTVRRVLPLNQAVSIANQGDFFPDVVELALDTQCMEVQQVAARTGLFDGIWQTAKLYSFGDVVQDGVNGTNTLNYYSCLVENTSGVWATDLAAGDWLLVIDTQLIAGYAAAAASSAAAAAVSAGSAAGSAASASTSASTASTAATTATTQAGISTAQAVIATTQAGIATAAAVTSTANAATTAANVVTTNANVVTTNANVVTAGNSATAAAASAATATTGASTATTQAGIATAAASTATTQAGIATTQAGNASASAAAAAASVAGLSATSATSVLIGTGNKVFTTQTGKLFVTGQFLQIASNANPANYMHGFVNTYSGSTLDMNITDIGGGATHADWDISISGTQGPTGTPANIDGGIP